jgi:rare lipoprotein A
MAGCWNSWKVVLLAGGMLLVATGCHHRDVKPLQPDESMAPPVYRQPVRPRPPARIAPTPVPEGGVSDEDLAFIAAHRPIYHEEGYASWYRAPYKGRRSANGQVFDDNAYTAAHRTLPMGSLIVVTNQKTGQSAAMRISDRGPFVENRTLDLTIASAKAVGVYLPGSGPVRVDVYQTPKPMNVGGRWCVQIGAFSDEDDAIKLKAKLREKYPTANVIEFPGENKFWVRIRPEGDDRAVAEYLAEHLKPHEGKAYLTRLD